MNTVQMELDTIGYAYLRQRSIESAKEVFGTLGVIFHQTDVKIDLTTRALVTSDCALDIHTDHHQARYIAWYCVRQSSQGGDSILLDSAKVLVNFNPEELAVLEKIMLFEHKIFKGDMEVYPLLSYVNQIPKIYYSFWMVNEDDKKIREFIKFKRLIDSQSKTHINLAVGDVLIVDNNRILHGRSKIEGSKDRHLKRFWISPTHIEEVNHEPSYS